MKHLTRDNVLFTEQTTLYSEDEGYVSEIPPGTYRSYDDGDVVRVHHVKSEPKPSIDFALTGFYGHKSNAITEAIEFWEEKGGYAQKRIKELQKQ